MDAKTAFDKLATQYDHAFMRPLDLMEDRVAFDLVPQRGHILDLGCGTGLYLEHCSPNYYVGLDISPGMLEIARSKFPRPKLPQLRLPHWHFAKGDVVDHWEFVEGDMADLKVFHDDSFDAVISMMGSFSYCLQPYKAIDEMQRVLKPGGTIFIMAYGHRYIHRESHITGNTVPFTTWDHRTLKDAFKDFRQVKVMGLSGYIASLFPRLMALEVITLGRLWPSSCYFQLVTGIKVCLDDT